MPRSKNDPYKRKSAQALNHLAGAILDVNDVYTPFQKQADDLAKLAKLTKDPVDIANAERYKKMAEDLKTIMMGTAAVREHLIMFIGQAWNLDEESVRSYLG